MDFRDFIGILDEASKKKPEEGVYTPDEVTPVEISGTPKGQPPSAGSPPPPAKGPQPDEVEVIRIGPQPSGKEGKPQKGPKVKESEKSEKQPSQEKGEKSKESKEKGEPEEGEGRSKPKSGEIEAKEGEAKITREYQKPSQPSEEPSERKLPRTFDSHDILEKGDASDAREIADKILEKGEKRRQERGDEASTGAGGGYGGFIEKLRGLYKPKIDWVRELKEKIKQFRSQASRTWDKMSREIAPRYKEGVGKIKSRSYSTYLREPKSHIEVKGQPGMLFKGPYVKAPIAEIVLIVALDTSGSIPERTIEKVFGEMDKIANTFKQGMQAGKGKMQGKVYLMMWDWGVNQIKEYKPGDWKKYVEGKEKITGGGGTDADVVFEYINKHFRYEPEVSERTGVLNLIETPTKTGMSKNDVILPVKKTERGEPAAAIAPFLVVATDGYFAKRVTSQDMGTLYKDNLDSIVYLIIDGTGDMAYPKNIINYESYRV